MSSQFGWNVAPHDSTTTHFSPVYPPYSQNQSPNSPPYAMSLGAGSSLSPQSPPYHNFSHPPLPNQSPQPPTYQNGLPSTGFQSYSSPAPYTPPQSPPPPYSSNDYYHNIQEQQNYTYNNNQFPPHIPSAPIPQVENSNDYHPLENHQYDIINGNNSQPPSFFPPPLNSPSGFQTSFYKDNGTKAPEGNVHTDANRIYPQITNPSVVDMSPSNHQNIQHYSETPLPANLAILWESSRAARLFFVQQEGHVVSPDKDVGLTAYKCPPMTDLSSYPPGSLAGNARNASVLVKTEDVWRLGLHRERSYMVRGSQGEYAFYDDSTSPARYVVLVFQKDLKKEERQRLDVLLAASSLICNEPSNVVDKLESGVESVFDTITHSVDNAVRKQTPDLHKNTKWLRKGTGQIVRFGGNLVSKGVHLVSDNIMDKEKPKEATSQHQEIFNALKTYRLAIEKKKVSIIPSNYH